MPSKLSLEIDAQGPSFLLAEGEHLGFRWVVAHNGQGHRCGYLRIPPGHPWYRVPPRDIEARVHGGLDWSEMSPDGNYWVGFDAAHAFDLADLELPMPAELARSHARTAVMYGRDPVAGRAASVRSQAYMEGQCRSLCVQAAVAGLPLPRTMEESESIVLVTPDDPGCPQCGEPILPGGLTQATNGGALVYHRECLIRSIVGSVGHLLRRCPCFGGVEGDPPGMTDRQAARAACDLFDSRREEGPR
jgi:hypothetical protein